MNFLTSPGTFLSSWRKSTIAKYKYIWSRWLTFCDKKHISSTYTTVENVLEFLTEQYTVHDCKYSGICAARSALSSLVLLQDSYTISSNPLIVRFVKGIYNRHPPTPKYSKIWDVNSVLQLFKDMDSNEKLTFKQLSQKLVTLFMILGANRKNALTSFTIDDITLLDDRFIVCPSKVLKHSRPTFKQDPLVFTRFPLDEKLCIMHCLKIYLKQRKNLVSNDVKELFITYGKPHKPATTDAMSRWIKNTLEDAGIDITLFTSHSCRAASTSKAKLKMPIKDVMKGA